MKKTTFIIAEAGINHNGSVKLAKELVDIAVEARADAVKFQTFITDEVMLKDTKKLAYQDKNCDKGESQYEMVKALELSQEDFLLLKDYCKEKGVMFLSTPFDIKSLRFLVHQAEVPYIKIASNEITNGPLLLEAALTKKPIILSTGMCTVSEIEDALAVIAFGYMANQNVIICKNELMNAYYSIEGKRLLKKKVSILHCTSEYPAPYENVNLTAIGTMSKYFDLEVGYSDHTLGIEVSLAAVAMGAKIIEKHFTKSKKLKGPDHACSLEPHELAQMVSSIRNIETSFGDGVKKPTKIESEVLKIMRRSLVARCNIEIGEKFNDNNLTSKQPGHGISPMKYWDYYGKNSNRNYEENEMII